MSEEASANKSIPVVAYVFGAAALVALLWRLFDKGRPADWGGAFFQFWVAGAGVAFCATGYSRLAPWAKLVAAFALIPVGPLLLFGPLFFAPQALFPFLFTYAVLAGSLMIWHPKRKIAAICAALLLVPLSAYCMYSVQHLLLVTKLRTLRPQDVREVRISALTTDGDSDRKAIVIDDPVVLGGVVSSFKHTYPYSPNHESIRDPWRMTITLRNGAEIIFDLGKGNRVDAKTAWIEFNPETYQNPGLLGKLQEAGIDPWR